MTVLSYNYRAENWVEYAVGSTVVFLRFHAQGKLYGFWKWRADNYLMLFTWVIFTAMTVDRHEIVKASKIKVRPDMAPEDLARFRLYRKQNFAVWVLYVNFLWSLKGCLLILYSRLFRVLKEQMAVKLTAWLVALTYVGAILEVCMHCRPLTDLWIVLPAPAKSCWSGADNFVVVGVFNLATDLALFAISLRLVYCLRLPLRRKLAVGALLCSGLFTIIATVLRNVGAYIVELHTDGNWDMNAAMGWFVRETFVALVVVNIPCLRPLFSLTPWTNTRPYPASSNHFMALEAVEKPSHTFFRRYKSRTLQALDLTTVGIGEESTVPEPAYTSERIEQAVIMAIPAPVFSPLDLSLSERSTDKVPWYDLEAASITELERENRG